MSLRNDGTAKAASDFSQQCGTVGIKGAYSFVFRANNRHWRAIRTLTGELKKEAIAYADGYSYGLELLQEQYKEDL